MNLILKRDPLWLGSLPSTITSPSLLLLGGDGQQVAVPAPLLLAISPLVRRILVDIIPPAYSPCFLSIPDVSEEVLQVMVDILTTGATGGDHMEKMEDVRHVFEMVGIDVSLVSCHLESIQVGQALDGSIKEENTSEGPDEEDMETKVFIKSEDKNSADVEVNVNKSKEMIRNPCPKTTSCIKSVHKQVKFSCTLCPLKFAHKYNLVRHVKSFHHQIKFSCNLCPQKFTQKQHLSTHTRAVHDKIRFPCNLCMQNFTQKGALLRHIQSIHNNVKFSCNLCPQKYSSKEHLVRHVKSVHDQIKFPCNLCPQKLTSKDHLVRHIRAVHDQVKIPCNFFPQKFTQEQALMDHAADVHK